MDFLIEVAVETAGELLSEGIDAVITSKKEKKMNKSASAVHENFKFCSNLSPSAYKKAVILHLSPVQNDSLLHPPMILR